MNLLVIFMPNLEFHLPHMRNSIKPGHKNSGMFTANAVLAGNMEMS